MKSSKAASNRKAAGAEQSVCDLLLFVVHNEPNSVRAIENLRSLCEVHLKGRHHIQVIDVVHDFQTALEYNVIVTPTLLMSSPGPPVTIFGTLSDQGKVLAALRVGRGEELP